MKGYLIRLSTLIAVALAVMAHGAHGSTPGGVPKKFIGLCFDTMFNTPSNVLVHADAIDAVPWLDGIAITLRDIVIKTADGSVVTTDTCRVMQRQSQWTRNSVEGELPTVREIVKHPSMRESFLLAWISPMGNKQNRIPWGDDEGWKCFSQNMATLAWFAKESGLKGLMLDPEEYSGSGQYMYQAGDTQSFAECAMFARQRGREVFSAIFKEYPDAVIFFLWTFEHHVRYFADRGATDPRQISDDAGELLPYFYNGMLDVIPTGARFVDGAEHYSLTSTKDMYWKGALNQLVGAHAFVASENWGRYRAQLLVGNTHYLDMFSTTANPKSHWYHGPVDGSRLEHLRRNIVQSLQVADEYVWIYGESGRLIDWKGGPTKHQSAKTRLWEEQIPGLSETLFMAKAPDKLMALRKAERQKKGELKNLAEGQASLPCRFALEDKATHMELKMLPSVKGVEPGELYCVSQHYRFSMREGGPSLKVAWRKDGRPVAEMACVPLADKPVVKPNDWRWACAYVIVPEGADELVINASGELFPGDTVFVKASEVFKLDSSPDAAKAYFAKLKPEVFKAPPPSGRKWVFDEAAKKLTDGNWTLSASYARDDNTKKLLAVSGAAATGYGVLDFRSVEVDIGKKVSSISNFRGNGAITELIAPDIISIGMDGLKGCGALRRVAISPDVSQLSLSCLAFSTNLVHFSPMVFKETARLGNNSFLSCQKLEGDFVYEGTNTIPASLFQGTSITSFRAPRSSALGQRAFGGCSRLVHLSFAEGMTFTNLEHRAKFLSEARKMAGLMKNLCPENRPAGNLKAPKNLSASLSPAPCVKGVVPGELYGIGISMRAKAFEGTPHFRVKWRGQGKPLAWDTERPFSMEGPREDGVWRAGAVLVRVPKGADELVLDVGADVKPGESFEFDKVEIFKLGDPLPTWPEEAERPKQ